MTGWLLLRRQGGLWGIPQTSLRELDRGRPPRLELKSGTTLVADELLSAAVHLKARPFPPSALPYYPGDVSGLAIWDGQPVVLLRPDAKPPACLSPWGDQGGGTLRLETETDEAEKDVDGDESQ